jgi:multidrug resistance efflux pump
MTTIAARQELSCLNSEIASATADRDEAQGRVSRLERPTALLAEVTHEYAVAKAAHDAAVIAWYQGGAIGSRPAPSPAMLELERRIGELHQDVGASGDALQSAQTALDAQNVHLGQFSLGSPVRPLPQRRRGRGRIP